MILYYFLLSVLYVVISPLLILYISFTRQWQRLGFGLPRQQDATLWIHAASMGEVHAILPLARQLKKRYPQKKLAISTMTKTGLAAAEKVADVACFVPLDVAPCLSRFFHAMRPELLIVAETELWPGMLHFARRRAVPVVFVNARMSQRSIQRYRVVMPLFRSVLASVRQVVAQSDVDAQRFTELGFPHVTYTGNLKFAVQLPEYGCSALRAKFHFSENDVVLVWGSSRPGEEQLALKVFTALSAKYFNLKLVLVPRHLRRMPEITALLGDVPFELYTSFQQGAPIVVIDAMGVLAEMYACCDIAIVGGSFFDFGGHNPLEPAFYGRPVIMGPYHWSCRDSVNKLKADDGIIIATKETLQGAVERLLGDAGLRRKLGDNAQDVLKKHASSLKDTLKTLENIIAETV
jgi:3-deoxy-D-manno-octulosonic-acid transferase